MYITDVSSRKILLYLSTFLFIFFNVSYAIEKPVHPVTQAAKVDLPTLVIEKILITGPDHELSWYATVRNTGNTIPKNQLELTGYQLIGTKVVSSAGEKLIWGKKFKSNAKVQFARQKWSKARDATALKVVIKNKQNGKSVSKTVAMPKRKSGKTPQSTVQREHAETLSKKPKLEFVSAHYKGRGAFEVKIKNSGERGFMPNEIEIKPTYKLITKPSVKGKVVTNRSAIPVGKTKTTFSSYPNLYANGMSECTLLREVILKITDKVSNKKIERIIDTPFPKGELVDVDMENSKVTYFVKNTGSITTKYDIKTDRFTLYKWDTSSDAANLPNYHYTKNIITELTDLFKTSITLKPGETGSVSIDKRSVNNQVKRQFPGMKKNNFYMAAHFWVSLYTKPNESCSSQVSYHDSKHFKQGRSSSGNEINTYD